MADMDRPEDYMPSEVHAAARAVVEGFTMLNQYHEDWVLDVARAILKAREDAFEEAAKIAETHRPTMSLWLGSEWPVVKLAYEFATKNIASAIRQHSQKGER